MNNTNFGQPTTKEGQQVQNHIKQDLNANATNAQGMTSSNAGPYNPTTQEGRKVAQDIQSSNKQ